MTNYDIYVTSAKRHGHFMVSLGDNSTHPGISDEACRMSYTTWLLPLLMVSQRAFIYRRMSKTRPFDVTPPPRSPKPVVLGKTSVRSELDVPKVLNQKLDAFWAWGFRHANIVLCIPEAKFPIGTLANQCWNPAILTNLGAVVARGALSLAKREALRQCVCCIFRKDSYNISVVIFPPRKRLRGLYDDFASNCKFTFKDLERDFKSLRKRKGTR